ncbi:IS701 family transposase [Novosphingobium flavum]|uniref:IS701 family transposase n=1 Tax=Novosphingobium aerophilum TaxID=2839843 RepID=A0A7X1F625_9SPHN|nr:IS701 family transposase [Novosphingobium aerophilum]MBC2651077.1 IS701 family transposase [Novosphingobium aerophilum]MBC2663881.1 IS701 family transposase [Novosphingobium aerophilum]
MEWQNDLEHWLEPFLKGLGNKTRRRMCPAYIAGLIGPGDRKSIQPMAARVDAISYDRLHHFIGAGVWDSAPLEATLWQQADDLVGGDNAWLIIDDTALPKKGNASVGVAPQYASALGKNANCQTLVSVTLASGEVPLMLSLRLFLPESWTSNEARMIKAGVPEQFRQARTKPELAIEEIDRIAAAGVRFGCVLADAGYGLSAPFRQALSARGLCWAVGIPKHQKVYPADVKLVFPVAGRGRPRLRHIPDIKSVAAHTMLEGAKWRRVSWRRGTKGRLAARFAAMRVRIADGAPQRIGSAGAQHMPGEEAWLVGEHRSNGERKYYLANLPADTPIKDVAGAIKARWICEQAHQQLKEELGLDHFEGRSWTGLHRHTLMAIMAYAFLQTRRLAQAGRKKKSPRATTSAQPASSPASHH